MCPSEWKEALRNIRDSLPETSGMKEDEFLNFNDVVETSTNTLNRSLQRILAEVQELFQQNRWEDILALIYPVEEKFPELLDAGLDTEIRSKAGFALGQLMRFDEAISELLICVEKEPGNFYHHSSLAYTAYNSLYAAHNKEIFLRGEHRKKRIELAHKHFKKAQELRPDGVTNFYREAMLYKQIENKPEKSIYFFEKAVENWERLDEEEKKSRAQERKNYIKALYQLSSALLAKKLPRSALKFLEKCIDKDKESNFVEPLFKYFALGKINFYLNNFQEAKNALEFSLACADGKPVDFVYELLSRTLLAMGNVEGAAETIRRVPEKKRRPYYRWTEADILCAMKDFDGARQALKKSMERDRRSRHKALIRLAKIEYLLANYEKSLKYATSAREFFYETWNGLLDDAIFYEALNQYRLGDREKALELASKLEKINPHYPKLGLLLTRLRKNHEGHEDETRQF